MNEILLKTSESISDIAIAYLDEIDGEIKEIDQRFHIAVSAMSSSYIRLFLIGDRVYDSKIKIEAFIDPNDFEYDVKIRLGGSYVGVESFQYCSNEAIGVFKDCTEVYKNALPLDVLVTSLALTEKTKSLIFKISYELGTLSYVTSITYTLRVEESILTNLNPKDIEATLLRVDVEPFKENIELTFDNKDVEMTPAKPMITDNKDEYDNWGHIDPSNIKAVMNIRDVLTSHPTDQKEELKASFNILDMRLSDHIESKQEELIGTTFTIYDIIEETIII